MSSVDFPYLERLLAQASGLPVNRFRDARKKMARGLGWEETDAGLAYSSTGFHQVIGLLGLNQKKGEALALDLAALQRSCLAEAEPAEKKAAPLEGIVERFYLNRFMLGVKLKTGGDLVSLRIPKKREFFRRGMTVKLLAVPGKSYYELDGPVPRRIGQW